MDAAAPPEIVSFAHRLADAAGAVVKDYFRRPIGVDWKPNDSPVTEADRGVETRLRAMVADEHPGHGVVGEEFPAERADAEFVWVIDPIDGTRHFIAGIPVFTTLIALTRGGRPVLGVIDQPFTGERWIGGTGVPASLNGRPIRVRPCPVLGAALMCTSSPAYYAGDEKAAFERLSGAVSWTYYGADSYGFAMIAEGFMDLGVEVGLSPHDFLATAAVVEAAGGVATDWRGRPLVLRSESQVLVAGDAAAHAAALERLAG